MRTTAYSTVVPNRQEIDRLAATCHLSTCRQDAGADMGAQIAIQTRGG